MGKMSIILVSVVFAVAFSSTEETTSIQQDCAIEKSVTLISVPQGPQGPSSGPNWPK